VSGPAAPATGFQDRLLATIPVGVDVTVPVAFSRDGRHAAYVAHRGEESRAVLGDWRGKPYSVL